MAIDFIAKVSRTGNSLVITIPKDLVEFNKYKKGDLLSVRLKRPKRDEIDKGC